MNGPDHYREAERLLGEAESCEEPGSRALWWLKLAKLHTALAQVAATALDSDGGEWAEVAGTSSAPKFRGVMRTPSAPEPSLHCSVRIVSIAPPHQWPAPVPAAAGPQPDPQVPQDRGQVTQVAADVGVVRAVNGLIDGQRPFLQRPGPRQLP